MEIRDVSNRAKIVQMFTSHMEENMKKSVKIVSMIISIAIVAGICIAFLKQHIYLSFATVIYIPTLDNILTLLSEIILLISVIYIIYKYILCIVEAFKNKKKLKPILMIMLVILVSAGLIISKIIATTFLASILIPLIYIIGVITIPLIIIGIIMIRRIKSQNKSNSNNNSYNINNRHIYIEL